MKKIIKIKAVQNDIAISVLGEISNYMKTLPKSVIRRFRENTRKYAGMVGKNYNDLWEGIEKYKYN